jgi:hypothetical protein
MSINEGNTIQYAVNTAKVTDGTTLYWRTTGNVNYGLCSPSQIIGSNNGTIIVTNNQAVFNVSLNLNQYIEGTKTLGIGLSTSQWGPIVGATAQPININDTSGGQYYINYLVVGGGGAGGTGHYGAGGGGGGGGFSSGNTLFLRCSTYTITVGSGGAYKTMGVYATNPVVGVTNSGSNSSIFSAGPIGMNFVGVGGGGGGFYIPTCSPTNVYLGQSGGSGGGSGGTGPATGNLNGGLAIGSPAQNVAGPQGYPGGSANTSPPGSYDAAGGGGAGGAGGSPTGKGGTGGNGALWPFNNGTYAGGGGGGSWSYSSTPRAPGGGGYGGTGGRVCGPIAPSGQGGTVNLGGGGGGAGTGNGYCPGQRGGAGGSGIVILAIPTPNYPGAYRQQSDYDSL